MPGQHTGGFPGPGMGNAHGTGQLRQVESFQEGIHIAVDLLTVELSLMDGGNAGADVAVVGGLLSQHFQKDGGSLSVARVTCNITHT